MVAGSRTVNEIALRCRRTVSKSDWQRTPGLASHGAPAQTFGQEAAMTDRAMITDPDAYFAKGCGRCDRFATPDCSTRFWLAGLLTLRRIA